ncbi:MAG: IS200/IS605 family transposase [Candidatus Micrarchaeota archaeon]|nr:IS200/IS605 family transposase [Candidatus Micrarchaeota archaeon]
MGLSQYHLQWCPKYRYNAMRSAHVKEFLIQKFYEIADKYGMVVHNVSVEDDHVHLFVSIPITMSLSNAIRLLKGISAHEIFKQFEGFRKRYWGGHFWSRGCFFRSISNVTSGAIDNYIKNQTNYRFARAAGPKQRRLF